MAGDGACDLLEAWEIARPWFVDPDAGSFSSQAVHPTFMFQGEYDLVYRWRGTAEIIDLKASVGASDRTAGYHAQLGAYAALWRATHEGAPLPLGSRFGSSAPEMPWMLSALTMRGAMPSRLVLPRCGRNCVRKIRTRRPVHHTLAVSEPRPRGRS